jgi:hypothetical protein
MREKPAPEIVAELTVTDAIPFEVSVSDCMVVVFTVTAPKLKLPELTANCGLGAAMLVPLSAISLLLPVDELLLILNCPFAAPVAEGLNCTCNVKDCRGFSVFGRVSPIRVNAPPPMVAEFTVTGAVPVELSVNACVVAVFTVTLPKLRLPALTVN